MVYKIRRRIAFIVGFEKLLLSGPELMLIQEMLKMTSV